MDYLRSDMDASLFFTGGDNKNLFFLVRSLFYFLIMSSLAPIPLCHGCPKGTDLQDVLLKKDELLLEVAFTSSDFPSRTKCVARYCSKTYLIGLERLLLSVISFERFRILLF